MGRNNVYLWYRFFFDAFVGLKGISVGALLFGGTKGTSYYYPLPFNPNVQELYKLAEEGAKGVI